MRKYLLVIVVLAVIGFFTVINEFYELKHSKIKISIVEYEQKLGVSDFIKSRDPYFIIVFNNWIREDISKSDYWLDTPMLYKPYNVIYRNFDYLLGFRFKVIVMDKNLLDDEIISYSNDNNGFDAHFVMPLLLKITGGVKEYEYYGNDCHIKYRVEII